MAMNKYNKYFEFLNAKKKQLGVGQQVEEKKDKPKYLPYFNPNRAVKKESPYVVRVLPRKGHMFFLQFKKHSFKIGATWKNVFCFYSRNSFGEAVGNECPFCDFIEENKESLSRDTLYKIKARDSYMIMVYDYNTKEIMKYETNDYGITDVLGMLQEVFENESDFDIDKEGFDLHFIKGKSGYADISKVTVPETGLTKLIDVNDLPDLEKDVIPPFNSTILKSVKNTLELAINAFEPTFREKVVDNEPEEEAQNFNPYADDTFDEDFDDADAVLDDDDSGVKEKDEILDDDDEDLEDIMEFLEKRKKEVK